MKNDQKKQKNKKKREKITARKHKKNQRKKINSKTIYRTNKHINICGSIIILAYIVMIIKKKSSAY